MKIIDVFPFFNEFTLLIERIAFGYHHVDYFIISDAEVTFVGDKKDRRLSLDDIPEKYRDKVLIVTVPDLTIDEMLLFMNTYSGITKPYESILHKHNGKPLSTLANHFIREVFQRDYPINFIRSLDLDENTIVITGDLDEFHDLTREELEKLRLDGVIYCKMKWLVYNLNTSYGEPWIGSRISTLKTLYAQSIDSLVRDKENIECYEQHELIEAGRHISFLGGIDAIKAKLVAYNYQGSRLAPLWNCLDSLGNWRIRLFLFLRIDVLDPRRRLYISDDNN